MTEILDSSRRLRHNHSRHADSLFKLGDIRFQSSSGGDNNRPSDGVPISHPLLPPPKGKHALRENLGHCLRRPSPCLDRYRCPHRSRSSHHCPHIKRALVKDAIGKGESKGHIHDEDQDPSNVEEVGRRGGYRVTNLEQAPAKGTLPDVRPATYSIVYWQGRGRSYVRCRRI